jgi:S1-C subfamily serine protease
MEVGDLIVSVDGVAVSGSSRLQAQVIRHAPGDRVGVEVVRGGETKSLVVTLGSAA